MDDEIIANHKISIPEIFEKHGEEFFRKIEQEALHHLVKNKKAFVIATGGGTPCFFDNMDFINKNGKSIFLDITPNAIADRLHLTETENRPLLDNTYKLQEKLENLLANRIGFYTKAHVTIAAEENLEELVLKLA